MFSALVISDRRQQPGEDLLSWLSGLAELEPPALLIREKDLSDRELYGLLREARRRLPAATRVLVSSRPDLALAAGLDGVHLPSRGLPIAPLRRSWPGKLLIGRSTHHQRELEAAGDERPDFLLHGPVFPPLSKPAQGAALGVEGLEPAVATGLPVLAVGGIRCEHIPALAAARVCGVAAISAFRNAGLAAEMLAAVRRSFSADPVRICR